MIFPIRKSYWLLISLTILSLCLAITLTPVTASVSSSPATNSLEQGRQFYYLGNFAQAVTIWQKASQEYHNQGDRVNEALSLSYLSLAQQELNQWEPARESIAQSLNILPTAHPPAEPIIWAQILNNQANLLLRTGQAETAIATWQQAEKYYTQAGDKIGSLGSQINQAQALQTLGFYRRSKQQLEELTHKLAGMPDSEVKVIVLRSLGLALHAINDNKSQAVLAQSLATATKISAKTELSSILLSLGKVATDSQDPEAALNYFLDAETAATNPNEVLQARLSRFKLLVNYNKLKYAIPLAPQLRQQLAELPPNHNALYAAINFVATLNQLDRPNQVLPSQDLSQLMADTARSAQRLHDTQAEAYALYQWGQVYQHSQEFSAAQELTEKALNIARQIQADDIIAQSAWQLGQLYKQQGDRPAAISSYTEAIKALKVLRSDLVAVNPDVQFSFRQSVEPVYRELVSLLLDNQPSQAELILARELIEALQIAELDNFFREACLDRSQQITQVDPTATIIYPIILPDRLVVIISKTGQPLRYYITRKSQAEIEQTVNNLLVSLNPVSDSQDRKRFTTEIYDWLIRPAEQDGAFKDTKTLVFVLDGNLRNIPMAALFDGQQFLIEKYAVALSPGLQLMAAQSLQQSKINAIIGGISESRSGFAALPEVESEVKQISRNISSTVLLNGKFTTKSFADRMNSSHSNVVHLATHGQFSSRIEDNYLLTWDGQVNIKKLSELLKNRSGDSSKVIELLVLSACDTAIGDDRAVLGLAGLAVKSGARSTIATLWPVKDKAAELLMVRLYEQLGKSKTTKAEALRQAQIYLIRQTDFHDPFFWSTFVLVGNWI
jgi:CHAT domain-containing protein